MTPAPRAPMPATLLGILIAAGTIATIVLAARTAASRDPLRRAWAAAQAAGTYTVEGTTRAATGDGVASYAVSGKGASDGEMTLAVKSFGRRGEDDGGGGGRDGGSGTDDGTNAAVTVHVAWPDVTVVETAGDTVGDGDGMGDSVRVASGGPLDANIAGATPETRAAGAIEPHAIALILPAGDPLALVAVGHGAAAGALEMVDGRACRRVGFLVGARAYAAWWAAHPRVLPVNADAGGIHKFTASATLWQDADTGRPCRVAARLDLPRLAGEQPGVGEVDWLYRDWGAPADRP